jgi:hypothetical protein
VPRPVRPWLVFVPLATLGVLAGHALAYRLIGVPPDELHAYLAHIPQITLVLLVLSLMGACLVERDARLALWPFPAVAVVGFAVQEHLERLLHAGSFPFLLDQPVFVVGLALQAPFAFAVWLVARLLLRAVGRGFSRRPPVVAPTLLLAAPLSAVPTASQPLSAHGPRAPPAAR